MYDDLLGPTNKKVNPPIRVKWDCPYCPNKCEWQEIWNKDIELELKELKLDVR